jgi:DNA-binding IclR family transcriptional regulator
MALNRSLERGLELLRAYRPGTDLLGNGELAERTGLPRATVSRLSQTLVAAGFLEHDARQQAYRLAAPILSLGLAMRMSSPLLGIAAPLMRAASDVNRCNVGLATADRGEMVYLESVRYARRFSLRNVVAGQRIPIERTSLGRAYLYGLPDDECRHFLAQQRRRSPDHATDWEREIALAFGSIRDIGFCTASWLPQVTALAVPIVVGGCAVHALNMSLTSDTPPARVADMLSGPLLDLADRLRRAYEAANEL